LEHGYFHSGGDLLGADPYCPLYQAMIADVMLGRARKAVRLDGSGSGPQVLHAMGEGALVCGLAADEPGGGETQEARDGGVRTKRSECVLSVDLSERSRELVRLFYRQAALEPQEELCCPARPHPQEVSHIPQEVLQRFYGCGSPIGAARLRPGQVVADLGCGAGIDCFIAAKKVGATGRVIGIDMTEEMLAVARENQARVAGNLGYDVVEFRQGVLEKLPLPDQSVDVVTSNCVLNLSPDKAAVFAEIRRVLKPGGLLAVSDIVAARPLPPRLKINPRLWGECTVGALTHSEFLAHLERAGFYGISLLSKTFYRTVEGFDFYSLTLRAYRAHCDWNPLGPTQAVVYLGPLKAAIDEDGTLFPRGEPVQVPVETAARLLSQPYSQFFSPADDPQGFTCADLEACCADPRQC